MPPTVPNFKVKGLLRDVPLKTSGKGRRLCMPVLPVLSFSSYRLYSSPTAPVRDAAEARVAHQVSQLRVTDLDLRQAVSVSCCS